MTIIVQKTWCSKSKKNSGRAKLNINTEVKMKMLNNRITFYEDYEENNKFFFQTGQQHYTNNTIQEREFMNGRIIDQTADILQEKMKFFENHNTSKFQMGNTMYDSKYEQEVFPQSKDNPRILGGDREII